VKGLLQKGQRPLFVATVPHSEGEVFDVTRNSLDQSFQGWLQALRVTEELNMSLPAVALSNSPRPIAQHVRNHALQLCQPVVAEVSQPANRARPARLTTDEYVQVMMATIREGGHHARWPKDVIAYFLAAEVITE
jgi:hypothetical protein